MGRINLNPSRVHRKASQLLETQSISTPPPWFTTIGSIPPSQILIRTQPVQHTERRPGNKKVKNLYKPKNIVYKEDKLRKTFFEDHPWELARPRVILEQDGKDGQRCDWSKMVQPGRQLNGER
jgi:small subunit ribosomal protein S23